MVRYLIKNKKYNTYLKYNKTIRFDHYVVSRDEATRFTKSEATKRINGYKHPDNWEIIEINIKKKTK